MNYEKAPLPWKARKIDCELWWVVEANNGAIIASGLPREIAQLIAGCPNLFSACESAISNLDSELNGGDNSTLTGGYNSKLSGGNDSKLSGGDCSKLTGGYSSTLTGRDFSIFCAGKDSSFSSTYWDGTRFRTITFYVGENGILPDKKYKIVNGKIYYNETGEEVKEKKTLKRKSKKKVTKKNNKRK